MDSDERDSSLIEAVRGLARDDTLGTVPLAEAGWSNHLQLRKCIWLGVDW